MSESHWTDALSSERYLLLDRRGAVLGGALMFHAPGWKRGRLFWTLPFLEGCRWYAGGRKKRRAKADEWRGIGALPYTHDALATEKGMPFTGSIKNARVHDHALSSEEIAARFGKEAK